ncbi:Eco57I restriction-modification methylase domain-containing protein [Nonomuraea endophytica]|uniref:site-specific DNA-methyltransferase (adenine-specific) n=1 Tax=Nonomuraea endophytica TaxID=714136 RepID=A0A7W8AAH2_9ACTN|nr:Eco57I restriction-modification methylase domain-containing protein [Nonomuraea endophytica]MBB5082621.1 hypothetical protein [Nonomuraea endophytica]
METSALVSKIIAWCVDPVRGIGPLDEEVVRGADAAERRLLGALGGVAKALVIRREMDTSSWPADINKWMDAAPALEDALTDAIIAELDANREILGLVYERIVAGKNRRKLGTFFTPADIMAYIETLIRHHHVQAKAIADPGAGVGAFSEVALKIWPEARVNAVDINLVTLGLLAASARPEIHGLSARLRLWRTDFLGWLADEWVRMEGPRLIFGNPPYTRHQLLTKQEKTDASNAAGQLSPSGRSGLSTYFLAASLSSLRDEDSLCLLLPVNWLEADYARSVRTYLWNEAERLVEIHLFPDSEIVFPGAQVSAMLLFVGPRAGREQALRIWEAKRVSGVFKAEPSIEIFRAGGEPATLMPSSLTPPVDPINGTTEHIALKDIASVRRGVATGNNKFFLLTDEQINELPTWTYAPAIARIREIQSDDFSAELHRELRDKGERSWILRVSSTDRANPAVNRLLTAGEAAGVPEAYLCKTRSVWYELEQIPTPHIIVSPMSKERFRVMLNSIGATPTNTLYGLRLLELFDSEENRRALVRWLRGHDGQAALTAIARRHGDGLLKLEPKALLTIRIPKTLVQKATSDSCSPAGQISAF